MTLLGGQKTGRVQVLGLHMTGRLQKGTLEAFNLTGEWPPSVLVPTPHRLL